MGELQRLKQLKIKGRGQKQTHLLLPSSSMRRNDWETGKSVDSTAKWKSQAGLGESKYAGAHSPTRGDESLEPDSVSQGAP